MLGESDLQVVHALQEAPRAPWTVLAGVLGTDARTIARRYERLRHAGYLRVAITLGQRALAGAFWAHLRARTLPGQALMAARQLAAWPQAPVVRVTDGSFEVYALLTGRDGRLLWREAQQRIARIPQIVQADLHTVIATIDVGGAERLDTLSNAQVAQLRAWQSRLAPHGREATRFTAADTDLCVLLNRDGRADVASLATELGRSPSSVARRITRLQSDGYIDFLAMIAEPLSSRPLCALIWCRIASEELPQLQQRRSALHWLGLLTVGTGRSNVMLMANLPTMLSLDMVLTQLHSICPSLEVHETQLSAQSIKRQSRMVTDDELWTDEVLNPYLDLYLNWAA